jgi:phosphotransferase system HPr-like phosphotransfer protein
MTLIEELKMNKRWIARTGFTIALVSTTACAPGITGNNAQSKGPAKKEVILSAEQLTSAQILKDSISGILIHKEEAQLANSCPAKLSRWRSAVGFRINHGITPQGFHATPAEAFRSENIGIPEAIQAFVCAASESNPTEASLYNVLLLPGEAKIDGNKATIPLEKSGASGYQSALSLEVTVEQNQRKRFSQGSSFIAQYYTVSSIKLLSANKEDSAELTFEASGKDHDQVSLNLRKYLEDNRADSDTKASSACKDSSIQDTLARLTFDRFDSSLARSRAQTFTTEVLMGGEAVEDTRAEHPMRLTENTIDLALSLKKPGRYSLKVSVPDPAAEESETEVGSIEFRLRRKNCGLEWIESLNASPGYTLEKR